jgi:hypothetical protein
MNIDRDALCAPADPSKALIELSQEKPTEVSSPRGGRPGKSALSFRAPAFESPSQLFSGTMAVALSWRVFGRPLGNRHCEWPDPERKQTAGLEPAEQGESVHDLLGSGPHCD